MIENGKINIDIETIESYMLKLYTTQALRRNSFNEILDNKIIQ